MMSGKRVLALYAAILFSFEVILCRLYFLAQNQTSDLGGVNDAGSDHIVHKDLILRIEAVD